MTASRVLPLWKPYRPGNGTEGMGFIETWCDKCARDAAARNDNPEKGCRILANTLFYQIDDPRYPKEWVECTVHNDPDFPFGETRCLAFTPMEELSKRAKRAWAARRKARSDSFAGDLLNGRES